MVPYNKMWVMLTLAFIQFNSAQANSTASPSSMDNEPSDTLFIRMNPVTVTAERTQANLNSVTLATSVIDKEQIKTLPMNHLADALSLTAGMMMVQRDGLGWQSDLMVRGFYGGGEAEYVQLLLDGQPLNAVSNGLVNWLEAPMANLDRIEIVRGELGSLYGDAALGGVINLISSTAKKPFTSIQASTGSFGRNSVQLTHSNKIQGHKYTVFGSGNNSAGYRDHSKGSNVQFGGTFNLVKMNKINLDLHTHNHVYSNDDPGPLPLDSLTTDRKASEIPFSKDGSNSLSNKIGLRGNYGLSQNLELSFDAWFDRKDDSRIRTLPVMSLEIGAPQELRVLDTQERASVSNRLQLNAQLTGVNHWGNRMSRWVVGSTISHATLDDKYYDVYFGSFDAYANMPEPNQDILLSDNTTSRQSLAAFAQETAYLTPWLKLALGGRYDQIQDRSDDGNYDKSENAFSPFVGVNIHYLDNDRNVGHFYANSSRAFKTPTLDQRFDQRLVRMPFNMNDTTFASFAGYVYAGIVDTTIFPPLSNAELNPQYTNSLEFGIQHLFMLRPNEMDFKLSLAYYTMDVKDEFDFDLETFRYVNIGKSQHNGLELETVFEWYSKGSLFVNYTYQDVVAKSGTFNGKYLKAIPRHFISTGVVVMPTSSMTVSLVERMFKNAYLDDANTIELDDYTIFDSKISYSLANLTFTLDVRNLLDTAYESTGYPDPTPGSAMQYFFPSAARSFQFGIQTTF